MRRPRNVCLWVVLVLIATSAVSIVAWGEVSLHTGEAGEAAWWYSREHLDLAGITELCASGDTTNFCTVADHWNVELATYSSSGDWAYVALDAAERFPLAEVTAAAFTYKMYGVQTDSGPSMAFSLISPTGEAWVAISAGAPPQTSSCSAFDATAVDWWWGTWQLDLNQTWDPSTIQTPADTGDWAVLKATLADYNVKAAMVLMGVTGSVVGSAGGNPIMTGQALVDFVKLEWTTAAINYGGFYRLEKEWPSTITFDDWTQTPLPVNNRPREGDQWCKCEHCLIVDDQNLWSIVHETDLAGKAPVGALPFDGSSPYALYFGDPVSANYNVGEAAVGAICSTYNELNPADEYVSISFDYFREVEQYSGPYDWTYVQIQFVQSDGALAWNSIPVTWHDPFVYGAGNMYKNPGDIHPSGVAVDPEVDAGCPTLGWKTVWYKDASDLNPGAWTDAVITHYLDQNEDPYTDSHYRIKIPPTATRMRIRFGFNSVDGANNAFLGWIVDNVRKQHSAQPTGCTILTDLPPQAEVGKKYELWLDPNCQSNSASVRSYELIDVEKDGVSMGPNLPRRMALDTCGRIYGEPDPGTSGTYKITLRLYCRPSGSTTKEIYLSIRAPASGTVSMIDPDRLPEYFDTVTSSQWTAGALQFGPQRGCPNLWHEAGAVKYVLATGPGTEYGDTAYFGQDDAGVPSTVSGWDPNYQCSRAKGCLMSPPYQVTNPDHDGQELVVGFKSWRNVELFAGGEYDITTVGVKFEGESNWTEVWRRTSKDVSLAMWTWQEVNTGLLLKYGTKIQVRFCFDSIDAYGNRKAGEAFGWLVDEVSLYAGSAELNIVNCPREETSVGDFYKELVTASGGSNIPGLIWEIAEGALPPGLGLNVDPSDRRKAYIEGIPRTASHGDTFTLRVRDQAWDEVATRQCTIFVGEEVTLMIEDFENDPSWSPGGLWHFTNDIGVTGVADLGVANHAAYYGQGDNTATPNYKTLAVTSGMLTLVDANPAVPGDQLIDIAGLTAFKVQFDFWRLVEAFGGQFDKTQLQARLDNGDWHTLWELNSSTPSDAEWKTVESGPYNTDGATTLSIRFVFNSVDKWYNSFTGWLIDNVKVESATTGTPFPTQSANRLAPRDLAAGLSVMNIPNPIRDVHTTTFMVRSAEVDAMRIEIYDLAGTMVFEEEAAGNELVWHTDNDYGEYLANGIYLYRAYVLVHGEWITTKAEKLVILR